MQQMQTEHQWRDGYRVIEVFGTMTESQQQQVLQLWASEGVVPLQQARQRVHEVACLILDPEDAVCGVSTAYVDQLPPSGRFWYFMRMFIRKSSRGVVGYPSIVSRLTRQQLARAALAQSNDVCGTAIITENPGLWKKGMHRKLRRNGWQFQVKRHDSKEVWVCPFEGKWAAK